MRQARIRPDKTEKRFKRPTFSVTAYTDVRLFCQNKKTESRPGRFLKGKHNSPKVINLKKSIDVSLMRVRFLHGAFLKICGRLALSLYKNKCSTYTRYASALFLLAPSIPNRLFSKRILAEAFRCLIYRRVLICG